jgi:hypothetical protein
MGLNWEQPFGRNHENRYVDNATENPSGLFIPRPTVNLVAIRRAQRMLAPFFESLFEEAKEALESANSVEQENAKVAVNFVAVYRRPDTPHLVQILGCDTTDHAVAVAYATAPLHPIVDYLFPTVLPSRQETKAHTDGSVIEFPKPHANAPLRGLTVAARLVFPGMAKLITKWLQELDGPLNQFDYCVRPAHGSKDYPQSIVAVTQLG